MNLGAGTVNTGKAVTSAALGLGGVAAKQTYHFLEHTTQGAGSTIAIIGTIPLLNNPLDIKVGSKQHGCNVKWSNLSFCTS